LHTEIQFLFQKFSGFLWKWLRGDHPLDRNQHLFHLKMSIMEPKKSNKASLENKRTIFLQTGMVLAMAASLVAFEWYSPYHIKEIPDQGESWISDLDPSVITTHDEPKVPPPPKKIAHKILIVQDTGLDDLYTPDVFGFGNGDFKIDYLPEPPEKDDVFYSVAQMPTYNGGDATEFWRAINKQLRYPALAQSNNMEGVVHISFVVDKLGKMTNFRVEKSTDPVFDQEVLRVLQKMGDWTPGYQRDKPVKVAFNMTFKFALRR
jgi:periplasmic protein TonB